MIVSRQAYQAIRTMGLEPTTIALLRNGPPPLKRADNLVVEWFALLIDFLRYFVGSI